MGLLRGGAGFISLRIRLCDERASGGQMQTGAKDEELQAGG
jgi:hypothetical protein